MDLQPGETATVNLTVPASQVGYHDENGDLTFPESGSFTVSAGGGQPGFAENVSSAEVTVAGE